MVNGQADLANALRLVQYVLFTHIFYRYADDV